jgi:acyl-CoA synthetase (AMP-forming)/AMP-acid ligase II
MDLIFLGLTLVLEEKFSASRFFEDCHKHKVTMIHYVGEMCRYLVNSPKVSVTHMCKDTT